MGRLDFGYQPRYLNAHPHCPSLRMLPPPQIDINFGMQMMDGNLGAGHSNVETIVLIFSLVGLALVVCVLLNVFFIKPMCKGQKRK